jgi:DNA-binding transcriptional MerR regulator/effector-binding domain-containing protein
MNVLFPIGDFSRMTHLSVKALRHYHDVGLLDPVEIDPTSGYRFYEASQVPVAQVIRRFRDLGMPIEEVKAVLRAPDVASRNAVIVAHLERMESQLEDTQSTVVSLRTLLERPSTPMAIEYRSVPATGAVAIIEAVSVEGIDEWGMAAFSELYAQLGAAGVAPSGPSGALFSAELFEDEYGEVVAFVPVARDPEVSGRVARFEVPAAELAIALHRGAASQIDQTYGALGTYVVERELGVEGPIREYYLVGSADTEDESQHRTEVGWPVFQTTPATPPAG